MSTNLRRLPLLVCAPLIACAVAGCAPRSALESLADDTLIHQFEQLHRRLYDVYSLGADRDAIHALLARSFTGEALTGEYVEHFTTLARMQAEKTAIEVLRVDYETLEVIERTANLARLETDWSVGGIVTHQGHRHARVNRYRAVYTLALAPEMQDRIPSASLLLAPRTARTARLRIVDTRIRNLERVRSLQPGTDFPLDDVPTSARGLLGPAELLRAGILEESAPPPTSGDEK